MLLLIGGCIWGLAFVPEDFKQGNSFRIIYIHVPAAAVSMGAYMMMATAAAIHLIWRMKLAAMVMKSIAPIGAALTFLALITGLGQAVLGNLVGMGCAYYLGVGVVLSLFRVDGAVQCV